MISLQTRFANFVTWIRPGADKVDDARAQRDEVRARICAKAEADGLTVCSTPNSGSFAKATGLRRHMAGNAEHEGLDIDCPFVCMPEDEDGEVLTELLGRFEGYANECYPDTPRERTKSSIKLTFVKSKRSFDIVPMLAIKGNDDEQILLRSDGERRRTSVQKHTEFVKSRTKRSKELRGPVAFNDCVRLMKWWRDHHAAQSKFLEEIPTFLLDLLCAKAFDEASVQLTYAATLHTWLDKIQSYAATRSTIRFADYSTANTDKVTGAWKVIDPVNGENNVVPAVWGGIQLDELRDWARDSRDRLQQAIANDLIGGRDPEPLTLMAEVFGQPFTHHSES